MSTKIAINGFGRIGRIFFKQVFSNPDYEIQVINDPATPEMMAYLLKYDSTLGTYDLADTIQHGDSSIEVGGRRIPVTHVMNADQERLPWGAHGVEVVVDCSGAYLSREKAQKHLDAGAEKVLISFPGGEGVPTIVYGVNSDILKPEDRIISAASCSTNGLAPMVQALHQYAPILSGTMTVVHGYTSTQMLVDNAQRKNNLRRSRAAANNVIPTTAEAAVAVGLVIPELNGKLMGSAVRVPIPAGCFINFVAEIQIDDVTGAQINAAMKAASSEVFGYTEEEYVSSDIVGMRYASLFDATQTMVCRTSEHTFQVRCATWFDNESSFVSQMVRCLHLLAK
ncbi:type I glyceraldehyde-3-phosphate dehydrogenase [Desulfobulbus rhabdoformis]|uniref:type I glyceraldehyde-3-phosphate dehydrogenase n=1 Tax=Desulfobulbus rhabdoformis TaxID=34032 RepID=UPI00196370E0|nr:glyceraldehyde 3-phosphate dehydrogenase NAD-binding domain-containing protein [Desulfobulbus rhabdoformis]MBM9616369.1 type I glyceraldehyde-3-phosphate dehydrogenase [Desulfobulbus rhabdoformis]